MAKMVFLSRIAFVCLLVDVLLLGNTCSAFSDMDEDVIIPAERALDDDRRPDVIEKKQGDKETGTMDVLEWPGESHDDDSDWVKFTSTRTHALYEYHACNMELGTTWAAYGFEYVYVSSIMLTTYVLPIQIPESAKNESKNVEVLDFRFMIDKLVAVTGDNVLVHNLDSGESVFAPGEIKTRVTRVVVNLCCNLEDSWCNYANKIAVVWDPDNFDRVYVSSNFDPMDDDLKFVERNVEDIAKANNAIKILHVSILADYHVIAIYFSVMAGSTTEALTHYIPLEQDKNGSMHHLVNLGTMPYNGFFKGERFRDDFGNYMFWDNNNLWYTDNSGQLLMPVTLMLMEVEGNKVIYKKANRTIIGEESVCRTVKGGRFAILQENGDILYGRMIINTDYRAYMFRAQDNFKREGMGIAFNLNGKLVIAYPPKLLRDESKIFHQMRLKEEKIDVSQKVQEYMPFLDANFPEGIGKCEVHGFHTSIVGDTAYLDKGSDLNFKVAFSQSNIDHPELIISLSNPFLLTVTAKQLESDRTHPEKHVHKWNLHVTSKHDDAVTDDYEGGITHLMVGAVGGNIKCFDPPSKVIHMGIACPPNKKIRVMYRTTAQLMCNDYINDYKYTITKGNWDPNVFNLNKHGDKHKEVVAETEEVDAEGNLHANYNFEELGCPLEPHVTDSFVPEVHLIEGGVDKGEVDADYVIHEVHGLNTFTYKKKVKNSGCKYKPQSWDEMSSNLQNYNGTYGRIWTRKNYFDCTKDPVDSSRSKLSKLPPKDQDKAFQVMGKRWGNAITWGPSKQYIYVFEVRVVDPMYTYCDLRTRFGVTIGEELGESPFPELVLWAVTCIIGFIMVAIYYHMSKTYAARQEREHEQIENFEVASRQIMKDGKGMATKYSKCLDSNTWEQIRRNVEREKMKQRQTYSVFTPFRKLMDALGIEK